MRRLLRVRLLVIGAVLASLASGSGASQRSAVAVEGEDRARILTPAGAQVEDYENAGYRLHVDPDGAVMVTSDLAAIGSKAPFEAPRADPQALAIPRLARALTLGAHTQYQAVSRILGWMARNLDYALDRGQSQAPEAVLERRSGYCTGIARLAVALIRAVDIPAREVAGYVVEPGMGLEVRGFHRWIEVRLADRGWLYSDPLASHHYVPASYVRLASELVAAEAGLDGLLLERLDRRYPVDLFAPAPAGITARRNEGRQRAAALRVRIQDRRAGTAVLENDRQRFIHTLEAGNATFVGLEPGRYTLRLLVSGLPVLERTIELDGPVRKALFFSAPATAAVKRQPKTGKGSP